MPVLDRGVLEWHCPQISAAIAEVGPLWANAAPVDLKLDHLLMAGHLMASSFSGMKCV